MKEMKQVRDKLNLRKLILCLGMFSVLVTFLNSFHSIYRVQHELVVNNTIESNRVYAVKMAEVTDTFIDAALSQLEYSASIISRKMFDPLVLQQEVNRLRTQTNAFNSVVIVNADGVIISVSPETIGVKGVQLTEESALQSLNAKAPLITDPFVSPVGNYLISMSYPIFSENGDYLGYVAGTIYLTQKNILRTILGQHSYKDGSYLYVVDKHQTLIYHPDPTRIGEVLTKNEAIRAVSSGEEGGKAIVNLQGVEMLSGYAPVKHAGWGIIVEKPEELVWPILNEQMWQMFIGSLPISFLIFLIIWVSSIFISKPLWQLASVVKSFESHNFTKQDLNEVKPWYFEASYLKNSFLRTLNNVSSTIDQLHLDALTDPMTGLVNRRGLNKAIDTFREQKISFSVLALDLDYFKKVNDSFGHDVGDALLVSVASMIRAQAREVDIVCRSGGEEFIVFLVGMDIHQAKFVAERIRKSIASNKFEVVGHVTISIGVSHWLAEDKPISATLKGADDALYQAKHNGRNRTELDLIK